MRRGAEDRSADRSCAAFLKCPKRFSNWRNCQCPDIGRRSAACNFAVGQTHCAGGGLASRDLSEFSQPDSLHRAGDSPGGSRVFCRRAGFLLPLRLVKGGELVSSCSRNSLKSRKEAPSLTRSSSALLLLPMISWEVDPQQFCCSSVAHNSGFHPFFLKYGPQRALLLMYG